MLDSNLDKNSTKISLRSDHPLLQIDTFCLFFNTDTTLNNCNLKDVNYQFLTDFSYATSMNLIFTNAKYKCVKVDGSYCNIFFNLTGKARSLQLLSGSVLMGEQVVIIGAGNVTARIDSTSFINVSATSDYSVGTQLSQGASYLSEGGTCFTVIRKTYGYYNQLTTISDPLNQVNKVGSQGIKGDAYTYGGGRIVIIVDSLQLAGSTLKLIANGGPLRTNQKSKNTNTYYGGSGGYIYIQTSQNFTKNSIQTGAMISADGGYGKGQGAGGSGGLIQFKNLQIDSSYISASPGQILDVNNQIIPTTDDNICSNGGPGMVYFVDLDLLSINPSSTPTTKKVFMVGQANYQTSLNQLELKNYTKVILQNTKDFIIKTQLRTFGNSSISTEFPSDVLNIKIGFSNFIDPQTYLNFASVGKVSISTTSNTPMELRLIKFKTSLDITAGSVIINQPSLAPFTWSTSSYIYLRCTYDLNFTSANMKLSAPKITLVGNRSVNFPTSFVASTTVLSSGNPVYSAYEHLMNTKDSASPRSLSLQSSIKQIPTEDKFDFFLYSNSKINFKTATITSQQFGVKCSNLTLNGAANITASSQATSTLSPIMIYATSIAMNSGPFNLVGKKVWIYGTNLVALDTLSISNSQIDKVSTGGSQQSDYHIAISIDREIRIQTPMTLKGSSVYLSAGTNLQLASPKIQTSNAGIIPSIQIQSGGFMNFSNVENGTINFTSAGQIFINSSQSIVKPYYGPMIIKSDIANYNLTASCLQPMTNDFPSNSQIKKLQQKQPNSQTIQIIAQSRMTAGQLIGIQVSQLTIEGQSAFISSVGDLQINSMTCNVKDNTKQTIIQSTGGALKISNTFSVASSALRLYSYSDIQMTGTYSTYQSLNLTQDVQITSLNGSATFRYLAIQSTSAIINSFGLLSLQDSNLNVGTSVQLQKKIILSSLNDSAVLQNINTISDSFQLTASLDANYSKSIIPASLFSSQAGRGTFITDSQISGGTLQSSFQNLRSGSEEISNQLENLEQKDILYSKLKLGQASPNIYKQQTVMIQTLQLDIQIMNTKIASQSVFISSSASVLIQDSSIQAIDKTKDTVINGMNQIRVLGMFNISCQNLLLYTLSDVYLDATNLGQVAKIVNQTYSVQSNFYVTSTSGLIRALGINSYAQIMNMNTSRSLYLSKSFLNISSKVNQNIQPSFLLAVNESADILETVIISTNIFISTQISNLTISGTNVTADRNLYVGSGDYLYIQNSFIIEGTLILSQSLEQYNKEMPRLQDSSQNLQLDSGISGLMCVNSTLNGYQMFATSVGDIIFKDNVIIRVQDQTKDIQFITKGGFKTSGAFDLKGPSLKINAQQDVSLAGINQQLKVDGDIIINAGHGSIQLSNFTILSTSLQLIGLSNGNLDSVMYQSNSIGQKNILNISVGQNITLSGSNVNTSSIVVQASDKGIVTLQNSTLLSSLSALSLSAFSLLSVTNSTLSTNSTLTLISQNSSLIVSNSNLINKNLNISTYGDIAYTYDQFQTVQNGITNIISTNGGLTLQNLGLTASNLTLVAGGGAASLSNLQINLATPYQLQSIDQANNFSLSAALSAYLQSVQVNASNIQIMSSGSLAISQAKFNLSLGNQKSNNKLKQASSTAILLAQSDLQLNDSQVLANQVFMQSSSGVLSISNSQINPQVNDNTTSILLSSIQNALNFIQSQSTHYKMNITSGALTNISGSRLQSQSYGTGQFTYPDKNQQIVYLLQISSLGDLICSNSVFLQSMNASIQSNGSILISGDIQVSQHVLDKQNQPATLNITAIGDINLNSTLVTDKVLILSTGGSIVHSNGQLVSNTNSTPPTPGNQIQLLNPDSYIYDVAYIANGSLNFKNLRISHYASYLYSGGKMSLDSSYLLSNMYGANYPGTFIRANDTIVMNNIDIFSDQLDVQSNSSILFTGLSNKVQAYQLDYKWGQDNFREVENQMRLVANTISMQAMEIQSYNSYFEGQNISIANSKIIRFSEGDTNRICLNTSGFLNLTSFMSYSAKALFMGNSSVTIKDLEANVFSLNQGFYQSKRYEYFFTILSQNGPITIDSSFQNTYIVRDVQIISLDKQPILILEPLKISMTDFENSPDPTIMISTLGDLTFQNTLDLNVGSILLFGESSITFLGQVNIQNQWMYHNVSERETYTFQLLSKGNITSLLPFNLVATNLKIQGNEIVFNTLKITTTDFVSLQPSIYFNSQGSINLENVQIAGGVMQLDGHDSVRISKANLTCLVPDNSSYSYEDGVYVNSKGNVLLERGVFQGLNIKLSGMNMTLNYSMLTATRVATSNNLQIYANNYLASYSTSIKGGQMIFIGPNGILFDSDSSFSIESDQNLISLSSPLPQPTLLQAKPHQESISFISTKIVQMKSKKGSHIYGSSIKIESDQVDLQNIVLQEQSDEQSSFSNAIIEIEGRSFLSLASSTSLLGQQIILISSKLISTSNNVTLALKNSNESLLISNPIRIDALNGQVQMSQTFIQTKGYLIVNSTNIQFSQFRATIDDFIGQNQEKISNLRIRSNGSLVIDQSSQINARKMFISGSDKVVISANSLLNILDENTCNEDESDSSDLFTCVPKTSIDRTIDEGEFLDRFSTRYQMKNISDISQTYDAINKNFSAYLFSPGLISISSSSIKSPRIGMCSTTISIKAQTLLDTSKRGCLSDEGLGAGVKFEGCTATGAANGGDGGPGAHLLDSQLQQLKCYLNHPSSYGISTADMRFEGSGGGSSQKGAASGGNGGGIIWISAANSLSVADSNLLAEGGNGIDNGSGLGSGGGSGGSIFLLQSLLDGNGYVSVKGGDGSINGGGSGAGGRIMIYYLGNYLSDFYSKRSINWLGTLDVSSGAKGALGPRMEWDSIEGTLSETNGTVWHAKCPPGHSGGFCEPCPAGTFKYGYSYGKCVTCSNKPDLSFYTNIAVSSANCPYQCNTGLDSQDQNPNCLEPFEFQIYRLGNQYMVFVVLIFILTLTFLQWICLIRKQKDKRNEASQNKINVYVGLDHEEEILSTQSNQDQDVDLNSGLLSQSGGAPCIEMRDKDLWYHSHRLYLIGLNSIKFPWILIKDSKAGFLNEQDQRKFDMMVLEHRDSLKWSFFQRLTFLFLKVIFPNLASLFHKCIRKRKYQSLKSIMLRSFDKDFWNDQSVNKSIRISCSEENFNLAHIDFIDYTKSFLNYTGPQLPMIILISGTGSFNNPYNIDFNNDPYIKSILLLNKRELKAKLPMYLENLNSLIKRLSFYNLTGQTLKDLNTLLEHVDFGNKHLFYPINVKMTVHLFENKVHKDGRQSRHSFPIDSQFFALFPRTFKTLMKYVKLRLFQRKSEIKFGLVLTKLDEEKALRVYERMNTLIKRRETVDEVVHRSTQPGVDEANEDIFVPKQSSTSSSNPLNFSIQREDTMMFADVLEDDYGEEFEDLDNIKDDNFEQRFKESIEQKPHGNMTKANESEVNYENSRPSAVSMGRSQRAFTLSKSSTKSLEISMEKDRSKIKHKFLRAWSILYSVHRILFQLSAKPPSRHHYILYLIISLLIATDAFVGFLFLVHLVNPLGNLLSFGLIYYCVYPLMPILSPVIGLLSTITGSSRLMRQYSKINALLSLANYPITIIAQLAFGDDLFYVAMVFVLILLKAVISFVAARVRADLENPHFHKNRVTLKKMTKERKEKIRKSMLKKSMKELRRADDAPHSDSSDDSFSFSSDEDVNTLQKSQNKK